MRILYVEDEEAMREVFAPMIQKKIECELIEAHSGNQAIQILKSDQNFDVIVSDYQMPDGGGPELLEYVAQKEISSYFIFFTNTINPEIHIHNKNFLGVIHKFEFNQLLLQIQKTFASKPNDE